MLQSIPTKSITIHVPDRLYRRLSHRAEQTRRTVEDEFLDAAVGGLPLNDELPPGLEDELQQLAVLSNDALLQIAGSRLTPAQARRLARLHRQAQSRPLSEAERRLELELMGHYERAMLLRARAVRLLAERGIDISPLQH
jgi:hypothetical protein